MIFLMFFSYQALNSGVTLFDIEKLRSQPEIIAPEYMHKLKEEFDYITMNVQV